jgi:UDP-4-amino-4,6-dideoxy-N-acetyl-beta-L-altrosamine N-acetyltransferase
VSSNKELLQTYYSFIDFSDTSDAERLMILEWRNHPSIRSWMHTNVVIKMEQHLKFIEGLRNDVSRKYWLVKRKGVYVGVYNVINIANNEGESGFYLSPQLHEKNLSVEFCFFSLVFLFEVNMMQKLYGYALANNRNAFSLNNLLGFSQTHCRKIFGGEERDYYYGELDRDTWIDKISTKVKLLRLVEYSLKNA